MSKESIIKSIKSNIVDHRTLHIRLTNSCNADCSYCSSYSKDLSHMSLYNVLKSVKFIKNSIYNGVSPVSKNSFLSIQYIGGEILTIDPKVLKIIVKEVEAELSDIFGGIVSGVQSNLIGSDSRVKNLIEIFGKRIGTSDEFKTTDRTVNGNSDIYKNIFNKNVALVKKNGVIPGVIFVLNDKSSEFAVEFYNNSKLKYSSVVFRPIFNGGIEVSTMENKHLLNTLKDIFSEWFLKGFIHVEPFSMLLGNYFNSQSGENSCLGCPFQSDCIDRSIDIEANGDLYICLDTADSGKLKLGNALEGILDEALFTSLRKRSLKIAKTCGGCPVYKVCHGGCLSESVSEGFGIYDKTPYCETWKELIAFMIEKIDKSGHNKSKSWFKGLV